MQITNREDLWDQLFHELNIIYLENVYEHER